MNSQLNEQFRASEVADALKQKGPLKAPDPDEMPHLFFQRYWPMVESDITQSVLTWLNSSTLPYPLNHTHITLIPKKKDPKYVTDYPPISLCNVLYKLFSKVLAN